MAKQLLLSGVITTGSTGDTFAQFGHTLVVIASATSWGSIARVLIECSADNGATWVPCKKSVGDVTGSEDAIIDGNCMFKIQPLGKDIYVRARAIQIVGTTVAVAIYLNELWL